MNNPIYFVSHKNMKRCIDKLCARGFDVSPVPSEGGFVPFVRSKNEQNYRILTPREAEDISCLVVKNDALPVQAFFAALDRGLDCFPRRRSKLERKMLRRNLRAGMGF